MYKRQLKRSESSLRVESAAPSLPDGFSGHSIGSDIQLARDGTLYAANRGADCIAVFSVKGRAARPARIGFVDVDPEPISFCLNEAGNTLYAAGKMSGRLCAYRLKADREGVERTSSVAVGREVLWIACRRDER